jgi:hypothetical protein
MPPRPKASRRIVSFLFFKASGERQLPVFRCPAKTGSCRSPLAWEEFGRRRTVKPRENQKSSAFACPLPTARVSS